MDDFAPARERVRYNVRRSTKPFGRLAIPYCDQKIAIVGDAGSRCEKRLLIGSGTFQQHRPSTPSEQAVIRRQSGTLEASGVSIERDDSRDRNISGNRFFGEHLIGADRQGGQRLIDRCRIPKNNRDL